MDKWDGRSEFGRMSVAVTAPGIPPLNRQVIDAPTTTCGKSNSKQDGDTNTPLAGTCPHALASEVK